MKGDIACNLSSMYCFTLLYFFWQELSLKKNGILGVPCGGLSNRLPQTRIKTKADVCTRSKPTDPHCVSTGFKQFAFLGKPVVDCIFHPGKRAFPLVKGWAQAGRNILGEEEGVTLIVAVLLMSCWVQSLIHSSFPFSFKSKHTNISILFRPCVLIWQTCASLVSRKEAQLQKKKP